jgi:Acetoacetate decarboxylase (ADC)
MKKKGLLLAGGLGLAALGASNYMSYKKDGTFREFEGIFCSLETRDDDLYASLLRKPMEMPERPTMALFVIDYVSVGPWPMTRYQEGTVALRCKYGGREGWHVKTMPVTKRVPCKGGQMLGFPKYVADDIPLRKTDGGWFGEVRHQGRSMLSLDYTSGGMRDLEPWEKEMIDGGTLHLEEPIFLFVPPEKGSRFQQVTVERVKPDQWKVEEGMARVIIDESEPWAGLVAPGTETPAFYQWFTGGTILVPKKLA